MREVLEEGALGLEVGRIGIDGDGDGEGVCGTVVR